MDTVSSTKCRKLSFSTGHCGNTVETDEFQAILDLNANSSSSEAHSRDES